MLKPSQRYMLRYRVKRALTKVTPLTWLIWALLFSDLTAPGYLQFNLIVTQFDAVAFLNNALTDQ